MIDCPNMLLVLEEVSIGLMPQLKIDPLGSANVVAL